MKIYFSIGQSDVSIRIFHFDRKSAESHVFCRKLRNSVGIHGRWVCVRRTMCIKMMTICHRQIIQMIKIVHPSDNAVIYFPLNNFEQHSIRENRFEVRLSRIKTRKRVRGENRFQYQGCESVNGHKTELLRKTSKVILVSRSQHLGKAEAKYWKQKKNKKIKVKEIKTNNLQYDIYLFTETFAPSSIMRIKVDHWFTKLSHFYGTTQIRDFKLKFQHEIEFYRILLR